MVCPVCDVRGARTHARHIAAHRGARTRARHITTHAQPPQHHCHHAQRDVDGEFGVIELAHDASNDAMTTVFGFMALHTDDALSILAEATRFTREQVALYGARAAHTAARDARCRRQRTLPHARHHCAAGTREVFVRAHEVEAAKAAAEKARAAERAAAVRCGSARAAPPAPVPPRYTGTPPRRLSWSV